MVIYDICKSFLLYLLITSVILVDIPEEPFQQHHIVAVDVHVEQGAEPNQQDGDVVDEGAVAQFVAEGAVDGEGEIGQLVDIEEQDREEARFQDFEVPTFQSTPAQGKI